MAVQELEGILKNHRLRNTQNRTAILNLFITNNSALSHADIENTMGNSVDRVTIYRTLKSFLDHGIIHKVLDDEGGAKYAYCQHECEPHHHHHNHVHFKCTHCGKTECLENLTIPEFNLPEGYIAKEMDLLVQGTCATCS